MIIGIGMTLESREVMNENMKYFEKLLEIDVGSKNDYKKR